MAGLAGSVVTARPSPRAERTYPARELFERAVRALGHRDAP
jgi:hypothetical protein